MIYCRNCGNQVHESAVMCTACGVPPWKGNSFCYNCKAETPAHSEICIKCGVSLKEGKDWMATLLLCVLLGYLGIHRFYTGNILIGILQLLTLGGCGIWTLIDLVLILTEKLQGWGWKPFEKKVRLMWSKLKFLLLLTLPLILLAIPIDFMENAHSICLFKNISGRECLACGSGRALLHLLHINIDQAMEYNKLSLLIFPLFVLLWIKELSKSLKLFGVDRK